MSINSSVCRHRPHEFSSEHGMKLTSDTDMGISFFREQHTLKYANVHEKKITFRGSVCTKNMGAHFLPEETMK